MIHNSSSDPVLIKKISLKIWSLRDEIESRIQNTIESTGSVPEDEILKIREFYTPRTSSPDNVLSITPTAELDSGEDEMAKAMAAVESEETESAEGSEESDKLSDTPAAEATEENIVSISFGAPNIPEDKISKGKTVLSEISMEKMFFFCNKAYTEGQSIVIQFCIPKSFVVHADILYCRPFNLKSRIISQNNYTHRVLIRFNFLKEGERALLRQFLQSIEPDLSKTEKKADASKNEEGGSDFNELDDLGL